MTARTPTLVEIAIEPSEARARPALLRALADLSAADPTCEVRSDEQSQQILLGGGGEEHVDALRTALRGLIGGLRFGAPQVAYRETIERRAEVDATHRKSLGDGVFEFARVKIAFAPADGWRFGAPGDEPPLPQAFLSGVEAGLSIGRRAGVLAGFPVVDVEATLLDGAWHDTDSTPRAFEAAALTAFRSAQQEAGVLLEPIMRIALTVPGAVADTVCDDLLLRRGVIARRLPQADGTLAIEGTVPLATTFGYRNSLRSLCRGAGIVSLAFSHFAPAPRPDPPSFPSEMAVRA